MADTIPRIIHRIWLDPGDDPMPDEFVRYGDAWRRLHPEWRVIDWTDPGQLPPLRNQQLFDTARQWAPRDWQRFQADLLRLELLDQYGGVYSDTDVEPLRAFDDLIDCRAFVAYSPNRYDGRRVLTQAVLAAVPAHPWISACIDALPAAALGGRGKPLAQQIGPHFIDRVYRQGSWPDVRVYETELFYPQSVRDRDAGRRPNLAGAYAHHRWATSRAKVAARRARKAGQRPPRRAGTVPGSRRAGQQE